MQTSSRELSRYLTEINDTITVNFVNPLRHDMPQLFIQWVQSINEEILGRQPITEFNSALKEFDPEGLFLTFNYTETLEHLYGVPSENICHIHNRVAEDETPIVGHNTHFKMDERLCDFDRHLIASLERDEYARIQGVQGLAQREPAR